MRASNPTLLVANRALSEHREDMVAGWTAWVLERMGGAHGLSRDLLARQLALLLDALIELTGPLRREAKPIWTQLTEHYGRLAASRGLAAGEVVEEMQFLRELLIRYLAPALAALRPRQGMALLLRLNRLMDQGVAMAVVGYTDVLVHSLLPAGPDDAATEPPQVDPDDVAGELEGFAAALAALET